MKTYKCKKKETLFMSVSFFAQITSWPPGDGLYYDPA
jgi:hypothetical protein